MMFGKHLTTVCDTKLMLPISRRLVDLAHGWLVRGEQVVDFNRSLEDDGREQLYSKDKNISMRDVPSMGP